MDFNTTESITSRQDFIRFLKSQLADFQHNKETWENNSLERFLEALTAYAEDIQGYYDHSGANRNADEPSWQLFADLLRGASIYE